MLVVVDFRMIFIYTRKNCFSFFPFCVLLRLFSAYVSEINPDDGKIINIEAA